MLKCWIRCSQAFHIIHISGGHQDLFQAPTRCYLIASRIPPGGVVESRCRRHDAELYFYPMNESNRRIASLNRIDELNQQVASQNDPLIASWAAKTVPEEPKSNPRPPQDGPKAPKTVPRGPKSPQKRPKNLPRRPKNPPGALLGRSWSHLGTIKAQDRNPDRPG